MKKKYVVNVSVADLRREPILGQHSYERDFMQESQVLFGECLLGGEPQGGWLHVECVEQQYCDGEGRWMGYPGWIEEWQVTEVDEFPLNNLVVTALWAEILSEEPLQVSAGTKLCGVNCSEGWWSVRLPSGQQGRIAVTHVKEISSGVDGALMISIAKKMVGSPYLWGGRSAYHKDWKTGVDCSGLTNLLYRMQGIDIPRNAHDQYLKSEALDWEQLQLGDLLFEVSEKNPERIDHVILYAGNEELIEATLQEKRVRLVPPREIAHRSRFFRGAARPSCSPGREPAPCAL